MTYERFLRYFGIILLSIGLGSAIQYRIDKKAIKPELKLACRMGFQYSALKYKVYKTTETDKIKSDAVEKCQDWMIEAFVQRNLK